MSGAKGTSRLSAVKKDGNFRYATRFFALEKGKRNLSTKEKNSPKPCVCAHKTDGWKGRKQTQDTKLPVKKTNTKSCSMKDSKKKSASTNHREKVFIVAKRSSSVSIVKSSTLRKSYSVKNKVSYSTSVVLSSEEDTDSEEESEEEEKKECSKKRQTIVKHTTSKVKSSVRESKKTENKSTKKEKEKAIKLLCNKLSSNKPNPRELRPRFPYTMLQEWPTARTHRMASLNALAKVHVLYENEGRTVGENLNDADECTLIDFLNEHSDDETETKKESKPLVNTNLKKNEKSKRTECEKGKIPKTCKAVAIKPKVPVKRGKKRKAPEVEIIDTRICKRMASLNAQAILAASYLQEPKPKRIYKKIAKSGNFDVDDKQLLVGSNCDLTIIKTEIMSDDDPIESQESQEVCNKPNNAPCESASKKVDQSTPKKASEVSNQNNWSAEPEIIHVGNNATEVVPSSRGYSVENSIVSSTATTKVGVTQYTEVTKVQINTHKDSEIKEESKSERKIERILANDDVAITQMYHYQSKSTNESYCLQMQTTYKPATKNLTPPASMSPKDRINPYINEPVLSSGQTYYGRTSHDAILPSQAYPLNSNIGPIPPPVTSMERRIPRQYGGSAFTVPHYRQSQHGQFSRNEYSYYQPAGPLIQPTNDQRTIVKPVPYHPQPNLHQPPQRPQQPPSHRDGFSSFESRHTQQNKSTLSPRPSSISSQQKPVKPTGPSILENLPTSTPSSSHFTRSPPADDLKSRSLNSSNSSTSFNRPSKHVRSPVMPTLYSSQHNFRTYQTQKRVPNSFPYERNSQPYERKDSISRHSNYESASSFNVSHSNSSSKGSSHSSTHLGDSSSLQTKDGPSRASTSHSSDHFKNSTNSVNSKERTWGFKSAHGTSSSICNPNASSNICSPSVSSNMYSPGTASSMCIPHTSSNICLPNSSSNMYNPGSSHFIPYQESRKEPHGTDVHEATRYPLRPPSVIEIVEDSPRDTKTYIQLEVPKNSHREKIVVVDVEDDEIEKKHIDSKDSEQILPVTDRSQEKCVLEKKCDNSSTANANNSKPSLIVPQDKIEPTEPAVKKEKLSSENDSRTTTEVIPQTSNCEGTNNETPDVMLIEVKKKKESAVVRRAKLNGKQRTFRDYYNRPLAQLLKTKKTDDISIISEEHLTKNFQPLVSLPRLVLPKLEKKPVHGWSWEGSPCDKLVYISNDDPPCIRRCYPAIKHIEGDIISARDCVFLRSGPRKTDLPFVAKVTALWDNPTDGEMTMSLLWYYRPEHAEIDKKIQRAEDEVFASKHRDVNSVACIEDKCYVLTYSEYCRYRRKNRLVEDNSIITVSLVPEGDDYPRKQRLPPSNISPDLVLFCRKVYDYRQKRLLKNPL